MTEIYDATPDKPGYTRPHTNVQAYPKFNPPAETSEWSFPATRIGRLHSRLVQGAGVQDLVEGEE